MFFLLSFHIATATPPPPPTYTWCTYQMIQVNTKEMISAAYGMGNVPSGTNLDGLCQAFYTRDIRAEDKPLELVSVTGVQNQTNPDAYWLANTSLMPTSPNSIRIPALLITALEGIDSPVLKFAAVVSYRTALPIMVIAGLVKAWKLAFKR
jgi:hypothetical protein